MRLTCTTKRNETKYKTDAARVMDNEEPDVERDTSDLLY